MPQGGAHRTLRSLYLDQRLSDEFLFERKAEVGTGTEIERYGHSHVTANEDVTPLRTEMNHERKFGTMEVHCQRLLDRFYHVDQTGLAKNERMILVAMYPMVKESFPALDADICEVEAKQMDLGKHFPSNGSQGDISLQNLQPDRQHVSTNQLSGGSASSVALPDREGVNPVWHFQHLTGQYRHVGQGSIRRFFRTIRHLSICYRNGRYRKDNNRFPDAGANGVAQAVCSETIFKLTMDRNEIRSIVKET
nr:putative clathrin assembly protein At2g25430 [Ipomoea batatas]